MAESKKTDSRTVTASEKKSKKDEPSFTIASDDRYPPGTEVSIHRVDDWDPTGVNEAEKPPSKPAAKEKLSDKKGHGSATFSGLDRGVEYVAYAKVGDQHRYQRFIIPLDPVNEKK